MKKRIIPLLLLMATLSGCASLIHEQTETAKIPRQEETVQPEVLHNQPPEPAKQAIRLPNDQIDFQNVVIEADISDQMIYVKQGDQTVRAMPTSSGLDTHPDNSTPRGEFVIEPERGEWFFAPQYKEGAKYWVSFKNHGEFLFHSIVMDENRQVIANEAQKLGSKASHGCFRLAVEDAKWIYDNIRTGTKVIIRE